MEKTKQIHLRVTPAEYQTIKTKAEGYSSISALVLDAVKEFDSKKGRNALDRMIEFVQSAQKFEVEQVRIGTNLNQIAHSLNADQYNYANRIDVETLSVALEECIRQNKEVIKALRHIIDLTT